MVVIWWEWIRRKLIFIFFIFHIIRDIIINIIVIIFIIIILLLDGFLGLFFLLWVNWARVDHDFVCFKGFFLLLWVTVSHSYAFWAITFFFLLTAASTFTVLFSNLTKEILQSHVSKVVLEYLTKVRWFHVTLYCFSELLGIHLWTFEVIRLEHKLIIQAFWILVSKPLILSGQFSILIILNLESYLWNIYFIPYHWCLNIKSLSQINGLPNICCYFFIVIIDYINICNLLYIALSLDYFLK